MCIRDRVITFWDMLPTLAEVAGYPVFTGVDGHSVWPAFLGNRIPESHEYLYWDYGHNRKRYDQAVRLGDWKAVRHGETGPLQLFNLNNDLGEADDVSAEHPEVVKEITRIMDTAVDPSDRYEIGELYTGKPIWNPTWLE